MNSPKSIGYQLAIHRSRKNQMECQKYLMLIVFIEKDEQVGTGSAEQYSY